MFNPFETNKQDVEQLFELTSEDILINGKPSKGIITEISYFRETEDKNLHTLDPITTGDYINWRGRDYMVINETLSKRHHKYKSLIRHCNYPVIRKNLICIKEDGVDAQGRPKFKEVYGEDYYIPTITSQRTFAIDERYAIRVIDKAVIVSVQDTELNRHLFAINQVFRVKDLNFKVINHERSVRGVLSIWAETSGNLDETVPEPIGGITVCED